MMEVQKHRGPDDSGYAIMDRVKGDFSLDNPVEEQESFPGALYFGFNRLSILDLSRNGHQPMYNSEAGVVFMFNGEIYNAFDYRDNLKSRGYNFKSSTDTEVALNLYLEYGLEGMLERINGMFAIAIYNQRVKKLFLIRDRYGIKPLYVLNNKEYFAFSSEMKSFKELPNFSFDLENQSFSEFLLFRNLINRTLFKGIENIEPGTYWVVDAHNQIRKETYYSVENEGCFDLPTYSMSSKKLLEHSLYKAVQRQMIADVKLGCQLSGGVDSSLVTYLANEFVPKGSLETISIIPSEEGFSEEKYMDVVIKQLQLEAHKYSLDAQYYFDKIDQATWHFEHPLNHPNTIGIYQLSQHARQHVTVLLSGEGADEVLAGYDRFATLNNPAKRFRGLLSKTNQNKNSLLDLYPKLLDRDVQLILSSTFTSIDAIKAVYPDFNFKEAIAFRKQILTDLKGSHLLRQRKYEILTYLPDLLMRQDKMSMAHSIENRVPFLDHDMVSNALSIDFKALMGDSKNPVPKYLLKRIAEDRFSKDFAFRKKQGFGIPLRSFFKSDEFQHRWREEWMPGLRGNGLLNTVQLDKWVTQLDSCSSNELDSIWLAVGIQLWYDKYIA